MNFQTDKAWWVVGGIVRWFDKRKGEDIGELMEDAAKTIKRVRGLYESGDFDFSGVAYRVRSS